MRWLAALSLLALLAAPAVAADVTTSEAGLDAFSLPAPALPVDREEAFRQGRVLFRQAWMMPPARDDAEFVGLGPVYNDISCLGCHVKNGRGAAPDSADQPMHGMLVRLSLPGHGPHGGPKPLPGYGDQLNDHANPGIPAEGAARVSYRVRQVRLAGGETVSLRVPHLAFRDLAFGTLDQRVLTSPRIAQPVFGDGLLEAIPEAGILARAAQQKAEGGAIHGHPNRVWNIALGKTTLGRFGWKANQPSLEQQAAGAANGDMGLTSPLFPEKNCPPVQSACAAAARGGQPELNAERLAQMVTYLRGLAVPQQRSQDDPAVQRGEETFLRLGCETCHAATWTTGPYPAFEAAAGRTIHPYSDLLLHDMGAGLADGRPDFLAGGRDWRTAPLWGVGLARRLNPSAGYLHDGRARSLTEAVLWHGGEAAQARQSFTTLSPGGRSDLLTFLSSL